MKAMLLAVILSTVFPCAAKARIAVIGNPTNSYQLTIEDITKIFLGKMRKFPNGAAIKPVDQAEGQKPRDEFVEKILHKNEPALKSYWSGIIFTGNGSPPDVLADDTSVKNFILANPNAIGYVSESAVNNSVKVFLVQD